MRENHLTFLSRAFLRSHWNLDYLAYRDSPEETALYERLERWSHRIDLGERSAEAAFLSEFFCQTWGYAQTGQEGGDTTFSLYSQFPVPGAGAGGGTGTADAALGYFDSERQPYVPQVLCEFKDIRVDLDAPQRRKRSTRSPVRQALNYLTGARRGLFGYEPILPMWALVTDMNEFRLYWHDRGERQFMRFIILRTSLLDGVTLLDDDEDARFDRFLFSRVFHKSMLVVDGTSGRPPSCSSFNTSASSNVNSKTHSMTNTATTGPSFTKRCCATTTRTAGAFREPAAALCASLKNSSTDASLSFSARTWDSF